VQVAALLQDLEGLEADVDLVGHQEEAGRGVRVLEVGDERLEVGGLDLVDRLADDQAPLGHHRQRARGGQRRGEALLLEVEDVVVESGAGPRLGQHGGANRARGRVDQVALARQAVDRVDLAARDGGDEVGLGRGSHVFVVLHCGLA
jgi:hypothetical protein